MSGSGINLNGAGAGPIDYEWVRDQLNSLTVEEKDDWDDPSGGALSEILEALESGTPEASVLRMVDDVADHLNVPGPDGDSVLHLACLYGHARLVKLLLDEGANPTLANPEDGSLPLHDACAGGYLEIVSMLLDGHMDTVHSVDGDGETPLHCAARGGFPAVVKFLLEHGADVMVENSSGHTALQEADHEEVKQLLLYAPAAAAAVPEAQADASGLADAQEQE